MTTIANAGEDAPLPQEFCGWTVRLPEVAPVEKAIVTLLGNGHAQPEKAP